MVVDPYRILAPLLRRLEPERAHTLAVRALASGLVGLAYPGGGDDPVLATSAFGLAFKNPVGIAAGFDKNACAVDAALKIGCGFVEVGAVTPRPQDGNPRPRLFRLESDRAVINRLGFNSEGMAAVAARLKARRRKTAHGGPVGVNLGKNKESPDAAADYAALAVALSPVADFLVINVSSPNTPGLRSLQDTRPLAAIIRAARAARDDAISKIEGPPLAVPPILLKVSPDLAFADLADIAALARAEAVDGLVIANTTIGRPASLTSPAREEAGGLSGAPLFALSTRMLRRAYELTEGKLPLIGVGGICSGADAYAKIRAGASLVQVYSGLVFEGPGLIRRIKRELAVFLKRDGFASVAAAVGADHRAGKPVA